MPLVVGVSGPAYTFEYAVVDERQDAVTVGVVESASTKPKRRVGVQRTVDVDLAAPLGNRIVIDALSGRALPVSSDDV